ncbi:MAG TPA: hypothetical protein VKG78_07165, partial [Opitutaceae bacterium]|nr:hypothetical protein [Opitutaceae bacterium]
ERPAAVAVAARAVSIDADDVVVGPTPACRQFESSFPPDQSGRRVLSSNACALRALLFGPVFSTIHSLVLRSAILEDGVLFPEDVGYLADVEYYLHTCLRGDIVYDTDCSALFRVYATQESSVAKGPMVSRLWRKVVERNRRPVARKLGIPIDEIIRATEEILSRHHFIMSKPDRATLRNSKATAFWRMAGACLNSPRLAMEYARCGADRERFLAGHAVGMAQQLSAKHGIS